MKWKHEDGREQVLGVSTQQHTTPQQQHFMAVVPNASPNNPDEAIVLLESAHQQQQSSRDSSVPPEVLNTPYSSGTNSICGDEEALLMKGRKNDENKGDVEKDKEQTPSTSSSSSCLSRLQPYLKWFALLTYIVLVGSNLFLQRVEVYKYGDELSSATFTFFVSGGMMSILFLFGLVMIIRRPPTVFFNFKLIGTGLLCGVLLQSGHTCYMLMTQGGGEASLLAPLSSLWAIVPPLLFVIFTKAKLTLLKGVGLLLGLTAIVLFALSSILNSDATFKLESENIVYFVAIVLSWGIGTTLLQGLATYSNGDYNLVYLSYTVGAIMTILVAAFAVFKDWNQFVDIQKHMATVGISGILAAGGNLTFILMCKAMPQDMAVVSPLASNSVLVPIILGIAVLGESTEPMKIGGIVAAIICVPLMAYSPSVKVATATPVVTVISFDDESGNAEVNKEQDKEQPQPHSVIAFLDE
eukprot:m.33125 g.33125  ORF g.33125 m.33125 type:complete len:468 (-) comp9834_c0_seq1:104-1507(-)